MSVILIFTFIVLLAAFLLAAWPLIFAPAFRAARLCLSGSCCLGVGAGIVALAAGMLPLPALSARALADDKNVSAIEDAKLLSAEADPLIGESVIEIPPGRPNWIGQEPSYSGKVHTIAVASGPYATNKESLRALDEAIVKATKEYISEQLNSDLAPRLITYDARTIKRRFAKEDVYHDEVKYSVGKMHENFALLQFDQKFRSEIARSWNRVRANSRLLQTGVFAGAAILVLGSVFGFFRAGAATGGRHGGRLQVMTAVTILTVVGAGVIALRFIPSL